jgi:hypothetical protein
MFYSFHWKIPKAQACGARQPVYRLGFLVPPAGNGGGSVEARPRLALAFWVCVVVGGGGGLVASGAGSAAGNRIQPQLSRT